MTTAGAHRWTEAARASLAEMIGRGLAWGACARALAMPRNQVAAEAVRMIEAGVLAPPPPAPIVPYRRPRPPQPPRSRPERQPRPPRPAREPRPPRAPKPPRAARPKVRRALDKGPPIPVLTGAEIEARVGEVAGSRPRPWMERGFGQCAWPVSGDGAAVLSCCAPCTGLRRYCDPHFEVMFQRRAPTPTFFGAADRQFLR